MKKLLAPEKLLWFYRGYTIKEATLDGEPVALGSLRVHRAPYRGEQISNESALPYS